MLLSSYFSYYIQIIIIYKYIILNKCEKFNIYSKCNILFEVMRYTLFI